MHARNICPLFAAAASLAAPALARQGWLQVEEAKLVGNDTNAGDRLGAAVAIDGDTVIVGAPRADLNERGAAYVFVRANGTWTMQAKLTATLGLTSDLDHFGASVALDGDVAVVGAPNWGPNKGQVYVFQRAGTTWSAVQLLADGWSNDEFGTAVAVSGTHVAVSAPWRGTFMEGEIAIYEQIAGVWTHQTWIPSAYQDDDGHMGAQIGLALTAPGVYTLLATTNLDAAEVYQGYSGNWGYIATLYPGTLYVDGVALSTSTLAIGASYVGKVQVYSESGAAFTLEATLQSPDPGAGDRFGAALALDGDLLVVGEPYDGDPWSPDRGAAFLYERTGTTWNYRGKLVASDPGPSDRFGYSLGIADGEVILGAPEDTNASGMFAGSAYAVRVGFPSVTYCTAGTSSSACIATMSSTGTPSASLATPFTVHTSRVDGQRDGILFYGVSGRASAPWSATSYLCVQPPFQRTDVQGSGGTQGLCDGAFVLDWNAFAAASPGALGQTFASGDELCMQAWYRGPFGAKTTEMSDGLYFVLQP